MEDLIRHMRSSMFTSSFIIVRTLNKNVKCIALKDISNVVPTLRGYVG